MSSSNATENFPELDVDQNSLSQKKKPILNLDSAAQQQSSNPNGFNPIGDVDLNNFDSYGLSMDEINLLYSPTYEISPSDLHLNLKNGAGGESGTGNLATIGAYPLPSLTDSLTDSLADQTKAIGDSEEAKVVASNENNDSTVETKAKRKYTKRTKKTSVFSFDGFDCHQDSPTSSIASTLSPPPSTTNRSSKSDSTNQPFPDPLSAPVNFVTNHQNPNVYHPGTMPHSALPNTNGPGFDASPYQSSSFPFASPSNGDPDMAAALPLLSLNNAQGFYPNSNFPNFFTNQGFPSGTPMQMFPPMMNGLKGGAFPVMGYGYPYGQLNHQMLNQMGGQPQYMVPYPPNMYFAQSAQMHHAAMTGNPAYFMQGKAPEGGQGQGQQGQGSNTKEDARPSHHKSASDGMEDFIALEMLSLQMETDQEQQNHYQNMILEAQKAQYIQMANQQASQMMSGQHHLYPGMMMPQAAAAAAAAAAQSASTSSAKRRPKATSQSTAKGKAAKGAAGTAKIKSEDCMDEEDSSEKEKGALFQMSHHSHNSHGHSGNPVEAAAMAMITSSSIKGSNRANNSLSTLSRRFVEHYGDEKTIPYISGQLNIEDCSESPPNSCRVDGAAETMAVHVRRIYELIKILEILSLIVFTGGKRGKFTWKGTKDFVYCLGCLQNDAISKFPAAALDSGLVSVTAAETFEKLLPSINNLNINAINAQTTAYTADLLLNMKSNSPTNSSTMAITNQLHQTLNHNQKPATSFQGSGSRTAGDGIAAAGGAGEESDASDAEPVSEKDKAPSSEGPRAFARMPPPHRGSAMAGSGISGKFTKPPRVTDLITDVEMGEDEDEDGLNGEGDGLVAKGKVSFAGSRIVTSGHDVAGPVTMTPVVKLAEDGSSTKKRSKEATPRKIFKSRQPGDDEADDQGFPAGPGADSPAYGLQASLSSSDAAAKNSLAAAPTPSANYSTYAGDHSEHFMMETICRNFLQLFLVGMNSFTMNFAVHSLIPMHPNETVEEYNKKNATKIRRVYDIANVLCSLNIVQKKHIPRPAEHDASSKKKESKTDLKVMVWSSYPPVVIRQHFLSKS